LRRKPWARLSETVNVVQTCTMPMNVMFQSIRVVGRGRVGTAVSARLADRGHNLVETDAELVLLCVPDAAIAEVAGSVSPGPWIAHTSGATPLAALAPHTNRFGIHPLQTIVLGRGP